MMNKQKFIPVLILALTVLFNACEKDNEQRKILPEPGFETSSVYYKPGDTVQFTNTSTDAETYRWSFDAGDQITYSEKVNPVIIVDIPDSQIRATHQVTLKSYSATGDSVSVTREIYVGYRALDYVKYHNINHTVINELQTDSITLYSFLGPESDPDHFNLGNNRTFPARTIDREEPLDVLFDVPDVGNLFYMFDEPWFLKLYLVNPDGSKDHLIMDKTFNPTQGEEWSEGYISGWLNLDWEEDRVEIGLRYSVRP